MDAFIAEQAEHPFMASLEHPELTEADKLTIEFAPMLAVAAFAPKSISVVTLDSAFSAHSGMPPEYYKAVGDTSNFWDPDVRCAHKPSSWSSLHIWYNVDQEKPFDVPFGLFVKREAREELDVPIIG